MVMWRSIERAGWGGVAAERMEAARPERIAALLATLREPGARGLLAVGAGCSYGDAGLNGGGRVLLTERLDRILEFDAQTGLMVAEPGVSVADVIAHFLPQGWCLPVVPGTGSVSLGGAVASDVHGKNQHRVGNFGDHVAWLDLLDADGNVRRLGPGQQGALFAATIGGMGMTGVITRIAIFLQRIPSSTMMVLREKVASLDALIACLAERSSRSEFSVAWIDGQAADPALGRGVVESADWSDEDAPPQPLSPFRVPFTPPASLVVPLVMRRFNHRYWHAVPDRRAAVPRRAQAFFFPLDRVVGWNRLYGPRGFLQFQCVVRDAAALAPMLWACRAISPTLVVLKAMQGTGRGLMSFGITGWSLAMDFPAGPDTMALLQRLHAQTVEADGQIYLAKDIAMTAENLPRMYRKLDRFRGALRDVDPRLSWQSSLFRRLKLFP
ncbi:FAD-binding oxidoreductase [Plastoroseomonas hellenica]|uniref:FAD-binding oxidoreductase n=1 Tax=Plastoroseomonas hellenica TaxID=2687306 RepID=UPI001BA856BB|nr:FAD-binding oxidoreductase [Plastoroseomonas hellenica]MBR0645974.1 FAD-binding oxidoreductase [Plastoroseomonas hellenica]